MQKLDSEGEKRDISVWQRTHDNALLNARFRLYLTATPRIYSPKAKEGLSKKAQGKDLMLFSMDDESLFGKEIYSLNFGKAISENLLSDFRVIISYCREEVVAEYLGKLTKAQENSKLSIESAGKMISFANALRKINMSFVDESGIHEAFKEDKEPMKRAVCFHSSIRNSKFATEQFSKISATILLDHIDGTHNAYQKAEKLSWLSEEEEGKCRVLSNAKCLTEGIDVPNLDAVCFFDKRDSIVDIVQAVGRTIRKSEGKKYGYIILPLVLTDEEIKDYNKTLKSDKFKIVWETLKALRSHDERLIDEARIAEVVSFLTDSSEIKELPEATLFTLDELFNEIKNAVPKNLGDLQYWEHYASKVGSIMHNLMLRIQTLNAQNAKIKSLFEGFCKALRGNLNVSFDTDDAIALIAQHIITKPIFECIFSNLNFATFDKVSAELEKLYKKLLNYGLGTETKELEKFYISVRSNAEYAKSDKSKQNLIKNLYDTLFKEAFKKTQEKLGIVYTPIQGVDFVIHSVAYALKKHFNKNLSDDNIHICDPFTGTGTFITRLLQSGYLDSNLESKYKNELWANEITLLGYYIAQINITTTYHDRLLKLKYLDSLSNRESSSRDIFSTAITSNSSAIAHTPEALSGRGIDKGEGATSPNSSPSPLSENTIISKEDIFYYIYALLNHPTYQAKYADNLSKMLPRIPFMKDFWGFVENGRKLASLHLNYENFSDTKESTAFACLVKDIKESKQTANGLFAKDLRDKAATDIALLSENDLRIDKIKFHIKGVKDTLRLNDKIAIVNIPLKAYEYKVNGKSPIEWVIDRYQVKVDKDSGIVNDPNCYESEEGALKGLKGGKYVLKLLLSVIEMSVQTMDILENLPTYELIETKKKPKP